MSGLGYDRNPMPASSIGATANSAAAVRRATRNGSSFLPSPVCSHVDSNIARQSFIQHGPTLQTTLPFNSATQTLPNFGSVQTFGGGGLGSDGVMVKGGAPNIATLIDHKILCMIAIKIWSSEIDVVTVTTSI